MLDRLLRSRASVNRSGLEPRIRALDKSSVSDVAGLMGLPRIGRRLSVWRELSDLGWETRLSSRWWSIPEGARSSVIGGAVCW
jgi:hypothetical protein